MGGIKKAVESSLDYSVVYVFTDAAAKDVAISDEVRTLAKQKKIEVRTTAYLVKIGSEAKKGVTERYMENFTSVCVILDNVHKACSSYPVRI